MQSGSSWVLIDAASANCAPLISKTAESLFGKNTPPATILLTHAHPDHSGSALDLARMWSCPVYVAPDELPLATAVDISAFEKYANPLDRWLILPLFRVMPGRRVAAMISSSSLKGVAQAFDTAAPVPSLPDWQCIPTPGHVAFFRPADRVLITGDAVVALELNSFAGFVSWWFRLNKPKVSGPPRYSTWSWTAAKESAAVLARLEPRVLASGHGPPISGDGTATKLHAFAARFSGTVTRSQK